MNNNANGYTDSSSSYGSGNYDDLNLFGESPVITVIKGIVGAVVGALPGFLVWLLIARLGYVSSYCGALIAIGTAFGYGFMTKKRELPAVVSIVICVGVMALAVYMATRIDWAWEIAKAFEETVWPEFSAAASGYGLTSSEIEELYKESMIEEIGFAEATFSNCFSNLSSLIEYLDLKTDYIIELVKSGACALLGGGILFAKFKK